MNKSTKQIVTYAAIAAVLYYGYVKYQNAKVK